MTYDNGQTVELVRRVIGGQDFFYPVICGPGEHQIMLVEGLVFKGQDQIDWFVEGLQDAAKKPPRFYAECGPVMQTDVFGNELPTSKAAGATQQVKFPEPNQIKDKLLRALESPGITEEAKARIQSAIDDMNKGTTFLRFVR